MHYVYILICSDGSLYVGHTRELRQRLQAHNTGKAARHTRDRRPVRLAYAEQCETRKQAIHRERRLKRWIQAKKAALIASDLNRLNRLSSSRRRS